MPSQFGQQIPEFQPQPLADLPPGYTTPLDYFKLFVDDEFVEKIVTYSNLYAVRKNMPELQKFLTANTIRTSHAVMFLTGYLTPANRAMFWEMREDTGNSFVKKAISRDTFRKVIRCTYFVDGTEQNKDDRFWKVRYLFDQLNKTAKKWVRPGEWVCVDEAMIKYFGPHPLKQFIRGKPIRFGYKIWICCTSDGQLLVCMPYAGAKTLLADFGLGMGPNVVYSLVKLFGLAPGTKVVCDNLFTSLDLLDHMGNMQLGVVGTMRQNR
jgi:DNA excision repair protein ERCC-6